MIELLSMIVVSVLVVMLFSSDKTDPSLRVAGYSITADDQVDNGPRVDGDDVVDSCGCVYKFKSRKGSSTHTSTIKCSDCKRKERDQEKQRRALFGR